jgi:pimeloyl-ACP methyl ester carboxylesterase
MILNKLAISLLLAALIGAALFWRLRMVEAASEAAAPPIGQFLTVNGAQVHVLVKGSGPDLVLIHGAGGNLRDFTLGLLDTLAENHRVIAFDRPGLGWSDAIPNGTDIPTQTRHLRAAAAALNVQTPLILAHSFGGAVALAWAEQSPDTRALVIVSGATMPFPRDVASWYRLTGGPLGPLVRPFITLLASPARVQASLEGTFAPNPVPEGYAEQIGAGLTTRRETLAQNGAQVLAMKENLITMLPSYPGLALPVELLHGTADTTVPLAIHAQPLSQILPNAALTVFEDTGHMLHHAHPQAVLDAVTRAAQR